MIIKNITGSNISDDMYLALTKNIINSIPLKIKERISFEKISILAKEYIEDSINRSDAIILVMDSDVSVKINAIALCQKNINTWAGKNEVFVHFLWINQIDSVACADLLFDAIRKWALVNDCSAIRGEVIENYNVDMYLDCLLLNKLSLVGRIPCRFIDKEAINIINPIRDDIIIRPAKESEIEFVIDLLFKAILSGLSQKERLSADTMSLRNNVFTEYISLFSKGDCIAFVAEDLSTRQLCGHATIQDGYESALFGFSEAELVDIFVLPEYASQQIGKAFTNYVLRTCRDRENILIRSTVVLDDTLNESTEAICEALKNDGWWFYSYIFFEMLD